MCACSENAAFTASLYTSSDTKIKGKSPFHALYWKKIAGGTFGGGQRPLHPTPTAFLLLPAGNSKKAVA